MTIKILLSISDEQMEKVVLALGTLSQGRPVVMDFQVSHTQATTYAKLYSGEYDMLITEEQLLTPSINLVSEDMPIMLITRNRTSQDIDNIGYYYLPVQPAYLMKKIQHLFVTTPEPELVMKRENLVSQRQQQGIPANYNGLVDQYAAKLQLNRKFKEQRAAIIDGIRTGDLQLNTVSSVQKIEEKEIPLEELHFEQPEAAPEEVQKAATLPRVANTIDLTEDEEIIEAPIQEQHIVAAKWIISPVKTAYYEGESFDVAGGLIGVVYEDDTSSTVQPSLSQLINQEPLTADDKEVVFSFDEVMLSLPITVKARNLTRLLMANPCKLIYKEGESPNLVGLQILALYADGTTAPIDDYTYEDRPLTGQDQTLSFHYQNKTLVIPIQVKENQVVSLDLVKMPPQEFSCGDVLTANGGLMRITYQDGSTSDMETETKMVLTNCDMLRPGSQKITLHWKGCSIVYEIHIKTAKQGNEDILPISLMIFSPPTRTNYPVDFEDLDLDGGVLNVFYSDQSCRQVPMDSTMGYDLDASEMGTIPVTVTYMGLKALFPIKIEQPKLISLDVVTPPTKTNYFDGDQFEIEGLELDGVYDNGQKKKITEFPKVNQCVHIGDAVVPIRMNGLSVPVFIHVNDQPVSALSLKTPPKKTVYLEGHDAFAPGGCVVTATLANGHEIEVPVTNAMVTGFDFSKPGTQTLTITYRGSTCAFDVTIQPKKVKALEVFGIPNQQTFCQGEHYDFTGIRVTAKYDNGTMQTVANYTIEKQTATFGDKKVAILYDGARAEVAVTVYEKKLESIAIAQTPTMTEYMQGKGIFSPKGGLLLLVYTDGASETIPLEKADITGFSNQTAGENELTVSYENLKTTLVVIIQPRLLMGLTVSALPSKVQYAEGECFDPSGISVTGIYNNGDTEAIQAFTYKPQGPLSKNDCLIIISFMNKDAIVPIGVGATEEGQEGEPFSVQEQGPVPDSPVFYSNSLGLHTFAADDE